MDSTSLEKALLRYRVSQTSARRRIAEMPTAEFARAARRLAGICARTADRILAYDHGPASVEILNNASDEIDAI